MSRFSAWLPSRRQLQQHLARLVDTLEALVQRLRESIARTVGEAVANAVHEVTRRLSPASLDPRERSGWNRRESWEDDRHYSEWDDGPAYASDRYRDDDATDSSPDVARIALAPCPGRGLPDRCLVAGPASRPLSRAHVNQPGVDRGPGQLRRRADRRRGPGRHWRRFVALARSDRSSCHQRQRLGADHILKSRP